MSPTPPLIWINQPYIFYIMSNRLIAIKDRGGFTDFPVSIQYLGSRPPTGIMVNWPDMILGAGWQLQHIRWFVKYTIKLYCWYIVM